MDEFSSLGKKRRIGNSGGDDSMMGISNLSYAMLVLALGFLIFAIMILSSNPDLIFYSQPFQNVFSAEFFDQNVYSAGEMEDSGYTPVGKVYGGPVSGELIMATD